MEKHQGPTPLRADRLAALVGLFDVEPDPPSGWGLDALSLVAGDDNPGALETHAAFQRAELLDFAGDVEDPNQLDALAAFLRARLARREAEAEAAEAPASDAARAFDAESEAVGRAMEERDALGQALGIYPPPRLFVQGSGWTRAETVPPVPDDERPAAQSRFDGLCDVLPGYIEREHRAAATEKARRSRVQSLARERVVALRNLLWRVAHYGDALTADRAVERWEAEQGPTPADAVSAEAEPDSNPVGVGRVPRPTLPFRITGNSAPAHAELYRKAVRREPSLRFGTFAALAEAAGVGGPEPARTIGRRIEAATGWSYTGQGVEAFVSVLFVAVGEDVPEVDGK